ncbi:hypothetical protein HDU93_003165, partial [Gonapodya sp. JEL0774]
KIEAGSPEPDTVDVARTVYETALLRSGYPLADMEKFSTRIDRIVRAFLGVDEKEEANVEIAPAKPKTEEEMKEEEENVAPALEDAESEDETRFSSRIVPSGSDADKAEEIEEILHTQTGSSHDHDEL